MISIGCKAGHKFVKTITKKDKKATEAFDKGDYETAISKVGQVSSGSHFALFAADLTVNDL